MSHPNRTCDACSVEWFGTDMEPLPCWMCGADGRSIPPASWGFPMTAQYPDGQEVAA